MSLFDHPHMRFGAWIEESIPGVLFVKIVCPCPAEPGQAVLENEAVWVQVLKGNYRNGIGKVMNKPKRIVYFDLNDTVQYCFDYENGRQFEAVVDYA